MFPSRILKRKSDGRFIACISGNYDPDELKVESKVTLTGQIFHIDKREIENNDDQVEQLHQRQAARSAPCKMYPAPLPAPLPL